jgi:hypothetical protein
VGGRALADLLGPQASGISVTQVVPFPWSEASEVGRAFKRFCRRHELERSFEAMEAWLAATLLVDGLRRAIGQRRTPESGALSQELKPLFQDPRLVGGG